MFANLYIVVSLLVTSVLAVCADDLELITADLGGNRIITTINSKNYAITGSNLPKKWQAVSINADDDTVTMIPEHGGEWQFSKGAMKNEMQKVFDIKKRFDEILPYEKNRHKFPTASFSGTNFDFSVRKDDLPNNWVQVIVEGDLVITLEKNGQIHVNCKRAMYWDVLYELKAIRYQLEHNK